MVNCVNGGGGCKYVLVMILSSGRAKTKTPPIPIILRHSNNSHLYPPIPPRNIVLGAGCRKVGGSALLGY
jgi:hypothetical protein